MRHSDEHLRTIIEHLQVGILLIDAESRNIVDVNSLAVEMTGLPKEKIINRACHRFICPEREESCPITDFGQKLSRETVLLGDKGKE